MPLIKISNDIAIFLFLCYVEIGDDMKRSFESEEIYYSYKETPHPVSAETALHAHDQYEILYFEAGEAELITEGQKRMLFPGDLLLLAPRIRHRINLLSEQTYRRAVLNFIALPDGTEETLFSQVRILHIAQDGHTVNVLERMHDYSQLFDQETQRELLQGLTVELLRLIERLYGTDTTSSVTYGQFMMAALDYIERNIRTISDAAELCEVMHVSRAYLYREFQSAMGISPIRYIRQKRLLLARQLLRSGETATKTCFACGFREYSAFFRAYCAFFGHAPQETRRMSF